MGRIIRRVLLILLIGIVVYGYFFLDRAGVFLTLEPVAAGACRPVNGVVGVEDLTIDADTKLAYLSGFDRRAMLLGSDVRGAIWVYDLNVPDPQPVDLTGATEPAEFQPHGISLYHAADGHKTLFVINHAGGEEAVEIFDVVGARLAHRRTVTGPELVSPNDVVGVGGDAFYVTNDHAHASGWKRSAEDLLGLRCTTVQFFDGQRFSTVLSGIGGANGINASADRQSVYVSAGFERTVYVYDRDPQTNALQERAAVPLPPGLVDNIELLANGDLLLGLHPKVFDLVGHVGDSNHLSPSHLMHLKADGNGSFVPETIYYNLGDEISGVTVGASLEKRLLIGSIFEPKILDCTWDGAPLSGAGRE